MPTRQALPERRACDFRRICFSCPPPSGSANIRTFLDKESRAGLILVSPPFLYALLLLAAPLLAIVFFSFMSQGFPADTTPSLDNYRTIASDPLYGVLLARTVAIAGSVTLVTVLLAFPIAYYVSFHVAPNKKSLWIFLITIPFWTSYLIRVFLWKVILGFNGVLNSSLLGIGIIDEPLTFILYNANAVVITLAHAYARSCRSSWRWRRSTARFSRRRRIWARTA